jgi:hypothetical protein
MKKTVDRGWCSDCGQACYEHEPGSMICVICGNDMKSLDSISKDDMALVEMQDWFADVCKNGKNGPSPGGAASELGCHRTMIDRLVGMGILEKSEFNFKKSSSFPLGH